MSPSNMQRNRLGRQHGFTLIEVLLSIAIFASLSVGAYQVLNQVQRSNEISLEHSGRLKSLQRTLVFMDSDFRQMALRQSRTNGEAPSPLLIEWKDYLLDSDAKGVMFVRLGWHNPQQQFPRGEVSKVGYRIKDNTLERLFWRYADTPAGQEAIVMPLLDDVEAFELRFFDGQEWKSEWQTKLALPRAVAVKMTLGDYGEIERLYLTGGGSIDAIEERNDAS